GGGDAGEVDVLLPEDRDGPRLLARRPAVGMKGVAMENIDQGPGFVFQSFAAYQRTFGLKAAIEVGLFGAIGQSGATVPEIARRCAASERGVRILADFLVVAGFLTKEGGRYGLGAAAAMFLDPASPACIASAIAFV